MADNSRYPLHSAGWGLLRRRGDHERMERLRESYEALFDELDREAAVARDVAGSCERVEHDAERLKDVPGGPHPADADHLTVKEDVDTRTSRASAPADTADAVYDFESVDELLRGWQVHVIRHRTIHEYAARKLEHRRYWLGGLAAALAAIAGSSAIAGFPAVAGVGIGMAAAILVSVVTVLDLGAQSERHRQASVAYKRILRRLELLPPDRTKLESLDKGSEIFAALQSLETELANADGSAPIPPRKVAYQTERRPLKVLRSEQSREPDGAAPTVTSGVTGQVP